MLESEPADQSALGCDAEGGVAGRRGNKYAESGSRSQKGLAPRFFRQKGDVKLTL